MEQRVQREDVDFLKFIMDFCVNLCMFNPWALKLSAQYTLQKTQDLNGCYLLHVFLVMTLVDVQFYQCHSAF